MEFSSLLGLPSVRVILYTGTFLFVLVCALVLWRRLFGFSSLSWAMASRSSINEITEAKTQPYVDPALDNGDSRLHVELRPATTINDKEGADPSVEAKELTSGGGGEVDHGEELTQQVEHPSHVAHSTSIPVQSSEPIEHEEL